MLAQAGQCISWADVAKHINDGRPQKLNPRAAAFIPENTSARDIAAAHDLVRAVDSIKTSNGSILVNYHYTRCDNSSSDYIKMQRGVVYQTRPSDNVSASRPVCRSFGYPDEYCVADNGFKERFNGVDFAATYNVYELFEGFHIRVYSVDGIFYISTHNKINAFESKWASDVSFGAQFNAAISACVDVETVQDIDLGIKIDSRIPLTNALVHLCSRLNKYPNMVYDFIVSNDRANHLVCDSPPQPKLCLLGAFDRSNDFKYIDPATLQLDGIPLPEHIDVSAATPDELMARVARIDFTKAPGLIFINKMTGHTSRLFSSGYLYYMRLRGQTPNVELRYLEIRKDAQAREDLSRIFPELSARFEDIERQINETIPRQIMDVYDIRYTKHVYYHTDKTMHFILRNLHSTGYDRITKAQVAKELDALAPSVLYKLIE